MFWVELRCTAKRPPKIKTDCHALSSRKKVGNYIGGTRKNQIKGLRAIEQEALSKGWTKKSFKWTCPVCAIKRRKRKETS